MAYIYDLTDTWNAGGTTFNAIKMNVTDSASAVTSKLVSLQTNGTEHFSVTKAGIGYVSGNLGIGTSSPGYKVDVAGIVNTSQSFRYGASYFGSASDYFTSRYLTNMIYNVPTGSGFVWAINGGDTMTLNSSGNVGIGTSSPSERLHVVAASSYPGYFRSSTGTAGVLLGGVSSAGTVTSDSSGTPLTFGIGGTEAVRITNTGNVGIGTSSPSSKLTVAASNVTVNAGYGIAFTGDQTRIMTPEDNVYGALINWGAAGGCRFIAGTSERMRIDGSGNLLVGTTSGSGGIAGATPRFVVEPPNSSSHGVVLKSLGQSYDVGLIWNTAASGDNKFFEFGTDATYTARGSITYNRGAGQVAYNVTSDARLKENIADATEAGHKIDAMQVRQFDWKETGNHLDYGFIAQELVEVTPEAVHIPEDEEKMMAVDYSKLVPMLVKEIQSLRARVAQLEGN